MVFSMNSRYALQKVQWIPPPSYIFTCLKVNEKTLSTKGPKEDTSKPPLRLNIPKDSPNAEPYSKFIKSAQPRSKSLISKSKKSFTPGIEDGFLCKSGSEMHFSSFRQKDELEQSAHSQETHSETPSNVPGIEYSEQNSSEHTYYHFYAPKEESGSRNETVSNVSEQSFNEMFTENLGKETTAKVENAAADNEESKNLYIVIDAPEKKPQKQFAYVETCKPAGEELRFKLPSFVQDDFEAVKSISGHSTQPKMACIRMTKRKFEGLKGKVSQAKGSSLKGERGKSNPKIRFQVHEIDDASTYVFQLKFKKGLQGRTCAVGCVPEKEINTRKMDLSSDALISFASGHESRSRPVKEVSFVADQIEYVKYPDRRSKGKNKKENSAMETSKTNLINAVRSYQNYCGLCQMEKDGNIEEEEVSNSQNYGVYETGQKQLEDQNSAQGSLAFQTQVSESVSDPPSSQTVSSTIVGEESSDSKNFQVLQTSQETDNVFTESNTLQSQTSDPPQALFSETQPEEAQPNPETIDQNPITVDTHAWDKDVKNKMEGFQKLESNNSDIKKTRGEVKYEYFEPDSSDFQTTSNVVRIQSERPPTPPKYSAGLPKYMNKTFKNQRKAFGIIDRDSMFGRKWSHRSDFDAEKGPSEVFRNPLFFSTKETGEVNTSMFKNKDDILHVYKETTRGDVPKMTDNMVNVANENLTEDKGKASVDSLAMMKQLKEIVDFDLKNAVKIFEGREARAKASSSKIDQKEEESCKEVEAKSETVETIKAEKPDVTFYGPKETAEINHETVITPKHLPGKGVNEGVSIEVERKSNSVIDFDVATEKFVINMKELKNAIYHRRENFDETYTKAVCSGLNKVVSNEMQVDITSPVRFEFKSGDSILIFDETTQTWKVDYSILEKRKQQVKEEEELTRRSEMILETFEKLEQGKISNIPRPATRERKTFDYNKEEWKVYRGSEKSQPPQKSSKSKLPFKESDAEEIRKRNSDMYDDLFIANKKEGDVTKEVKDTSETSKPKKIAKPVKSGKSEIKIMVFGSKKPDQSCKGDKKETPPKEVPCKEDKKETPPKEPCKDDKKEAPAKEPCKEDKKEAPPKEPCKEEKKETSPKQPIKASKKETPSKDQPCKGNDKPKKPDGEEVEEEEEGWEAYIKEDIPPLSSVPRSTPSSTGKVPTVPPNIKKIDPNNLKLPPLSPDITKIPPSKITPPAKSEIKIDEPKFRIPLPFGRKKKIDEPKTKPAKTEKVKIKDPKEKVPPIAGAIPGKPEGSSKIKTTQTTIVSDSKTTPLKEPPKGHDPKPKPPAAPKGADSKPKHPPPVPPLSPKTADPSNPTPASIPPKTTDPKVPPTASIPPKTTDPKVPTTASIPPKTTDPKVPPTASIPPKMTDPKVPPTASIPPKTTDPKVPPTASIPPKTTDPKVPPTASIPPKTTDPKVPPPVPSSRLMEDPKSKIPPSSVTSSKEHYVSDNIVEMSKYSSKDKNSTNKAKQLETVKLNITSDTRSPSKITEINLNKKFEEKAKETGAESLNEAKNNEKRTIENKTFYRNFEKYKTPFGDPEFEEKSVKINSDMESNPNLKKLDNWNKTLVLHDAMKPSENVESWLRDETDKMATLLLKVLQEAADGKPKRKSLSPKGKLVDKPTGKANPYDNIRKKQENTPEGFLFKVRTVNFALAGDANPKPAQPSKSDKKTDLDNGKDIPVQSAKTAKSSKVVEVLKMPEISSSETSTGSRNLPSLKRARKASRAYSDIILREPKSKLPDIALDDMNSPWAGRDVETKLSVDLSDDIPGPEILKKISGTWKMFPVIGCQATIFTLLRIFQLVNLGTSFWNSSAPSKSGKNAFSNLFTKYGPIVNLQGPLSGNIVLLHKPEHLTGVLEQDTGYSVRSIFDSLEQSRRETENKIVTVGISTDWNKPEWNDLKKASNDPLVRGCEKFFRPVEVAGESLISNIRRNRNNQNLVSDDFMKEIKQWSLEGLCTVLFEKSFGFLEGRSNNTSWLLEPEKFFSVIEDATEYLSKCERGFQAWRLMSTPSSVNLNQAYRSMYTILSKQLYQAELNLKNKNELLKDNSFIGSHDLTFLESMLLNDRMAVEDIICNMVDFLLIGVNTMSSALGFMLYNLAQNGKVQGKLLKEVKEMLPDKTSRLDYHKLHSLKYLQACLKESLRLNSPVPVFFRVLQNDVMISNYVIPKETYVVMDFKFSNMKEQVFEDPEKFLPERWLNDEKWLQDMNPWSSLPLCHGPRAELAKRVVEMQLWSCIARVVRNFQIEYHYGEIQGTENVFSHPDKPLKLNFVERDE